MEAVGLALSAVQTLFAALQSSEIKHLLSLFGYESQLVKLQSTVERVNAVLQDAEGKAELTCQEIDLVRKLKAAVFDADDLLDKFKTLAEQEQLLLHIKKGGKLRRKVRRLISRFGKLGDAYDMAREVRRIAEELEGISGDANKFRIKVDHKPLRKRREETCSYVYQQDIIGREEDVKNVIDLLLTDDDNARSNFSVVSIVGMGGLGKTALAQLVFQRIKEFPLNLWACVADDDKKFDVKTILSKILKSASDDSNIDTLGIDMLQRKVREKLCGQKYLLVLDDVWTENRVEWMVLENFLKGSGQQGSRIVVTTRSAETAKVVGNRAPYMLKGLSEEASWHLFKMVALGQQEEHVIPAEFFEIGRDIVQKCANVPLAIRVVGSLLFGQDKQKWLAIKEKGLSILGGKNDIKSILKFSYYHLESPLKSCFTYCALFPKDTVLTKQLLVSLWMAQGYLEPLNGDKNMENVGEEYFKILVRRCFFQDITNDDYGDIHGCKMHDLMHDIAQEIAGKEINNSSVDVNEETLHVLHQPWEQNNFFLTPNRSRTYFCNGKAALPLTTLFENWKFLRSLDLKGLGIKVLPGGIGELLHLRLLNFSFNEFEMLPESITKLHNLQTLHLQSCKQLKELPHDLNKLVKLRDLDIKGCDSLTFMPSGVEKLTCLTQLSMFVLGGRNSCLNQHERVGNIQDLQDLRNLKGGLEIRIMKDYAYVKGNDYICNKEHLKEIWIMWDKFPAMEGRLEKGKAEGLLETLQPHRNIIKLRLCCYPGARMPGWAAGYNLISLCPDLLSIEFSISYVLELPFMSKLRCLKRLILWGLTNLEYVEHNSASVRSATSHREAAAVGSNSSAVEKQSSLFFPFLQELDLFNLPKLKGWWRSDCKLDVGDDYQVADVDNDSFNMHFLEQLPSLPCLETLRVFNCPNLTCMPPCPMVREVELINFNEKLRIMAGDEVICSTSSSVQGQPSLDKLPSQQKSGNVLVYHRLRKFKTDNSGYLKSLPRSATDCLEELIVRCDKRSTLSGSFGEAFTGHPNSIRSLEIISCPNLKSLSGVLNHLSGLENLTLYNLPNLTFEEDVDEDEDMPWKSVANTLQTLKLNGLPKVVKVPKGIRLLTSLRQLEIVECPELKERCGCPDGLDWPIIENVPEIKKLAGSWWMFSVQLNDILKEVLIEEMGTR